MSLKKIRTIKIFGILFNLATMLHVGMMALGARFWCFFNYSYFIGRLFFLQTIFQSILQMCILNKIYLRNANRLFLFLFLKRNYSWRSSYCWCLILGVRDFEEFVKHWLTLAFISYCNGFIF